MVHQILRALRANDPACRHAHLQLYLIRIEQNALLHGGKIGHHHTVVLLNKAAFHPAKAHLLQPGLRICKTGFLRNPLFKFRALRHHPEKMPALPRDLHAHASIRRIRRKAERLEYAAAVRRLADFLLISARIARRRHARLLARNPSARQGSGRLLRPSVGKRSVVDQRRIRDRAFVFLIRERRTAAFLRGRNQMRIEPLTGGKKPFQLLFIACAQHAAAGNLRCKRHDVIAHLPGKLHRIARPAVLRRQARQTAFQMLRQQGRLAEQFRALPRAGGQQQLLQIDLDIRHRTDDLGHVPLLLHLNVQPQRPRFRRLRGVRAQREHKQQRKRHRQRPSSVPIDACRRFSSRSLPAFVRYIPIMSCLFRLHARLHHTAKL